jgi:hypothetical protein
MKAAPAVDAPPARPRASWKPRPKIRACLRCGVPRISRSAGDRVHAKCRPAGEQNDGERASILAPHHDHHPGDGSAGMSQGRR